MPTVATPEFLNVHANLIGSTLNGNNGVANFHQSHAQLSFFDDSGLNFPLPGDGLWFLSQFKRWGMLTSTKDWRNVAEEVSQMRLYSEVAQILELKVEMHRPQNSILIDGHTWDGREAIDFADKFEISVRRGMVE